MRNGGGARIRFRLGSAVAAALLLAACGQKAGVGGPDAAPSPASAAPSPVTVTSGATSAPQSAAAPVADGGGGGVTQAALTTVSGPSARSGRAGAAPSGSQPSSAG